MNVPARFATPDGLPLAAAGVTILVWSSSFAAISYGLRAFTPAELSLLRFLIASLLFAIPVATGRIRLPSRRDWPAVAMLGVVGITIYQLALGYAMTRIPVGAAAVVIALAPGVTSALAALRLGERISGAAIAGLAVAFAGVVLIAIGSGHAMRFEPMTLLVLVAVFATSIYFVGQKPLLARTSATGFTAASIFAGTIGLAPFGADLPARLFQVSGAQLASAVYLGIVPTIAGYLLWNWALSRAPASKVSSFLYAQPLIASLIAWVWLGQVPTPMTAAGGALAIGGVLLTVKSSRAPAAPPRVSAPLGRCCAEN